VDVFSPVNGLGWGLFKRFFKQMPGQVKTTGIVYHSCRRKSKHHNAHRKNNLYSVNEDGDVNGCAANIAVSKYRHRDGEGGKNAVSL